MVFDVVSCNSFQPGLIEKIEKKGTIKDKGKRSFVRAKNGHLTGGYQLRALLAIAPVRARPSAHFGFASTLRQNVWYPQVARCHAKTKIARKYVHVFAGKGKTGKPKNKREIGRKDGGENIIVWERFSFLRQS